MQRATFLIACFALSLSLAREPFPTAAMAQLPGTAVITGSGVPNNCGASDIYAPGSIYIQSTNGHIWTCFGTTWTDNSLASVPSGLTAMVVSGSCPSGYVEVSGLDAAMPLGTLAAHGDIGTTGGANNVTPTVATLTAAAQAFTGSSATTSAVSAGTPAGTNGTVTGPAQVVSWPVGVPAFSGTPGTVPAQTFTGSSATTSAVSAGTPAGTNGTVTGPAQVISWPAGVPTNAAITAGTPAGTISALTTGADSSTTGGVAKAIAQTPTFTGSALATHTHVISWPAGVPTNATSTIPAETFTGSALATHTHTLTATGTNGTAAFTPAGTNAWPVGVPTNATSTIPAETFTGSALGTHTHTLTATGTNGTSSVTGTLNAFNNLSAFVKVIYCSKS